MAPEPFVLGVWDGHDSGAALVRGERVLFAMAEERLSRRKLEVRFPRASIRACLESAGLSPREVGEVAYTTSDFAKTLTRALPSLKEDYYRLRRRLEPPSPLAAVKRGAKYLLTRIPPCGLTRTVSDAVVSRELGELGFGEYRLHCVEHHAAHAAGAYCSGFERAVVVTLDGIGDGLSGSVHRFIQGRLERLSSIPGRHSLGVFFEHVTRLMGMRELEDEGKVMALAAHADPVSDERNPMLELVRVEGETVVFDRGPHALYRRLAEIRASTRPEEFCRLAQSALERRVVELIRAVLRRWGPGPLVLSGGVASNVHVNRLLRLMPEVEDLYVFPCMADGGQALGAACLASWEALGRRVRDAQSFRLGPAYGPDRVEDALRAGGWSYERPSDPAEAAAALVASGEIVLWFQGRMELGPRALGGRSILAPAGSPAVRDALNLRLKRREWFQPFCPTLLEEDARELLEDFGEGRPDRFMTCAYRVKEAQRARLAGVIGPDGSCRPQILDGTEGPFARLLRGVKARTGLGAVLNTSLNLHGEPLACSPEDALRLLGELGAGHLFLEDFHVRRR